MGVSWLSVIATVGAGSFTAGGDPSSPAPSAALTGTALSGTEAQWGAGGLVLDVDLSGAAEWHADLGASGAVTDAFIAGLDSDGVEAAGYNAVFRDSGLTYEHVTRVSDKKARITFPAGIFAITANETLTFTIPTAAMLYVTGALVAAPTITISNTAETVTLSGTAISGAAEADIVTGGLTIIFTVAGDQWVATLGADNAITTAFLAAIDSAQAEATGWDAQVKANLTHAMLTRDSATQCTLILPAAASYDITATETITCTPPASSLLASSSPLVGSPTFTVTTYAAPDYPAPLRTFYVDAAAGGGGDGSIGTPWNTIPSFNAVSIAGDRCYLKGTFTGSTNGIRPSASGTAANKIVYEQWPGETCLLQGAVSGVAAWLDSRNHIVLKNLDFTDNTISGPMIQCNNASYIWIQGCTIAGSVATEGLREIQFAPSPNSRVEDCSLSEIGTRSANSGDAIEIANGSDNCVIVRNVIGDCGHAGIDVMPIGGGASPSDGVIIAYNTITNSWSAGIVTTNCTNVLVEHNDISDSATNDGGYTINSRIGIQISGSTDGTFRYNRIWNTDRDGISMQQIFQTVQQNCIRNKVYHNTIYGCGGGGIRLVGRGSVSMVTGFVDNEIINNLFWANHMQGAIEDGGYYNSNYHRIWIDVAAHTGTIWSAGDFNGNVFNNNWMARTAGDADNFCILVRSGPQGGNLYYTKAEFEALTPDAGSNNTDVGDPQMVDPVNDDFTLQAGAACVDTGVVIAGQSYLGTAPDPGAYEKE